MRLDRGRPGGRPPPEPGGATAFAFALLSLPCKLSRILEEGLEGVVWCRTRASPTVAPGTPASPAGPAMGLGPQDGGGDRSTPAGASVVVGERRWSWGTIGGVEGIITVNECRLGEVLLLLLLALLLLLLLLLWL